MIHLPAPRLCPCGQVHRPRVDQDLAHRLRPYDAFYMAANGKNAALTGFAGEATHGSLHTAYSTTGSNELTGGSPAYARKALTWATPSGGSMSLAATFPVWDVPAGTTVTWWGQWDAITAGNFSGMMPVGGLTLQPCSVETSAGITANTINAKAHGLADTNRCVFWGTLPTGLSVGTVYYVVAAGLTADVFEVSATSGGSAIDLTGTQPFNFFVQECVPEVFAGQATYALASGTLIDLGAVV